ncbi:MAG: hypothetical protein AB1330_13075 [Bacillota bacterium]|jgi:hypothetical protein
MSGIGTENLREILEEVFAPKSAYNSSTGAALTVALDTGPYGRTVAHVWVRSSAAATFEVKVSRDGTNWRLIDSISLTAAGEANRDYSLAYQHIQVSTAAANDNEIEISASR